MQRKRISMTKQFSIAMLEGDGIGPEIMREAVKVLDVIQAQGNAKFDLRYAPFGGQAYFDTGAAFPDETKKICDELRRHPQRADRPEPHRVREDPRRAAPGAGRVVAVAAPLQHLREFPARVPAC